MMKKLNYSLAVLLTWPLLGVASEDADPARGKELAVYCSGCHGEYGIAAIPSNPNLAGQNKEYLEYAIKAYRDGTRKGGMAVIMRPNVRALSDQDVRDLASYFSGLSGK